MAANPTGNDDGKGRPEDVSGEIPTLSVDDQTASISAPVEADQVEIVDPFADPGAVSSAGELPVLEPAPTTDVIDLSAPPVVHPVPVVQPVPVVAPVPIVSPVPIVAPVPVVSPVPVVEPQAPLEFEPAEPTRPERPRRRTPGRRGRAPRRSADLAPPPVEEPEAAPIGLPIPDEPTPHAEIALSARYEFTSVPADDPPLMGLLVQLDAIGEPLVEKGAGPVAHVVLALDLSKSMDDPEKYPVLRKAVGSMLADLQVPDAADVLLSVVIFAKGADVIVQDVPARAVTVDALFSKIEKHPLCFGRYTDIAGALGRAGRIAYDQTQRSKALPVRVYLLTDGRPQDVERARHMADRLGKVAADLHALAFGADADVSILQELFAGKRGGTVKSVRADTIGTAFERVAEVAQNVVATRCLVSIDLDLGVVGGDAFRYRPARVRFPEGCFEGGKRFRADLGTVEAGRTYSLLFEVRPPERDEAVTKLGDVVVRIPGFGGPIETRLELTLPRTAVGSEPGDVDTSVRTARDILSALTDDDPQVALRALRLRRDLYVAERRDVGLVQIIEKAIELLESTGSLDTLAPGDLATLRAHTCTASGGDEDLAYLRG